MARQANRRRAAVRRTPGRGSGQVSARRLGEPVAVAVTVGESGGPERVGDRQVEAIRDSWVVEDRWWTAAPIRRRYWEVITVDGALIVVFCEPGGRWLTHR